MAEQLPLLTVEEVQSPAPVYAVHCFFNCSHVVREGDSYAAGASMERHYEAEHRADIDRAIRFDPPSPTDPPQRRRKRR